MQAAATPYEVAIIGSGFAGLGLAIHLKRAGIDAFVVLEKGGELGGTWRDNRYPGAACDVQSHLYSYSFEPKHDWTRKYAQQPEILGYMRHCAAKYGLHPHLRLHCEISEARFDEAAGLWTLSTADGQSLRTRVLVTATGQLNQPLMPALPGIAGFQGTVFHSARWPADFDAEGRRIAVVGTGASAIQFVPELAPQAAQLHVFQRSAPWVIPKPDRPFAAFEQKLFARLPLWDRLYRALIYCSNELRAVGFSNLLGMKRLMKLFEWQALRHMRKAIADPALRARLKPDYPIGCKRILISNNWYTALARPNVEVVTDAIDHIEADAVVTRDGRRRPVDAIIYATGFAATGFLAPMQIYGLAGRELNAAWRDGAEAYKGITVAGFPNLFMLYGPNTNLAHSSIVYMIESQLAYVMQGIRLLRDGRLRYLDTRAELQSRYNLALQQRLDRTVWQAGCTSWYKTASGKNTVNWPGFTFEYRHVTAHLNPRDHLLVT